MIEKFMIEKFMVEKSSVEAWGWKSWGCNILQPFFKRIANKILSTMFMIYMLKPKNIFVKLKMDHCQIFFVLGKRILRVYFNAGKTKSNLQ